MNIITEYDNLATSEKAVSLLGKFKDFVHARLKVLQEQIDAEDGKIIIKLIPSGIEFQDFSIELIEKMKSCISEEDFMYISAKIMEEESD